MKVENKANKTKLFKKKRNKRKSKVLMSDKKQRNIRRLHYGSNKLNIIAMVTIIHCKSKL